MIVCAGLSSSSTSTWVYTMCTARGFIAVDTTVSADLFCRVNIVIIIITDDDDDDDDDYYY